MLTRLLHACGLYLGPQEDLMPPQADNPDGFWEHLRFVALNDQLLNELGGAWDLPPPADEDFTSPRLDPLRMKARMLIEGFESATLWGWKDPRNSLTLPFWLQLLPGLKTIIMVRNPLEVAHSMRERNGTSYSFGLRLWEIYNRRLIDAANQHDWLVTHYDLFFQDAETELRRIAEFVGLPRAKIAAAAKLITKRRRHTHFTVDNLIDARVAPEVIDLYRSLIAETTLRKPKDNQQIADTGKAEFSNDAAELLPGAISRLNTFVPERLAQIEELYSQLLAQAERRHKAQVEELTAHLAQTEAQLQQKSVDLARSESCSDELRERLRKELKSVQRLCRLLEDAEQAAARLRSSARWQIANPVAAVKARLSPKKARRLLGYGHLEKLVLTYQQWRTAHPEIADIDEEIRALASGAVKAPARALAPREPPLPARSIVFPVYDEVEVSIIIPVFNQVRFTKRRKRFRESPGLSISAMKTIRVSSLPATAGPKKRAARTWFFSTTTRSCGRAGCGHYSTLSPSNRGRASSARNCSIPTVGCRRRGASSGAMPLAGTTESSMTRTSPNTITCVKWIIARPPR